MLWHRLDAEGREQSGTLQVLSSASIIDPRERRLLRLILAFKPWVTKCSLDSDSFFSGKIKVIAAVLAACRAVSAKPVEISH